MVWGMIVVSVFLLVAMTVVIVEVMSDEGVPTIFSDPAQSALVTDMDLKGSSLKELDLPRAA